jgi:hypothetical protein
MIRGLILGKWQTYLVSHHVGAPTHLIVPSLQLVSKIVDLNQDIPV